MTFLTSLLGHTPRWVFILLAYLIFVGWKARSPGEVTPQKMAILPVLFTVWGLLELHRIYTADAFTIAVWLGFFVTGAAIGVLLVQGLDIRGDRARGVIVSQGDKSLLPLVLVTFAVKYAVGVVAVTSPQTLAGGWGFVLGIAAYSIFAGIFAGKFYVYMQRYLAAPATA